MANYKRGRPKNARAGCLLCHSYKANGTPPRQRLRASDLRRLDAADAQLEDVGVVDSERDAKADAQGDEKDGDRSSSRSHSMRGREAGLR